jgi:hypothetical protein
LNSSQAWITALWGIRNFSIKQLSRSVGKGWRALEKRWQGVVKSKDSFVNNQKIRLSEATVSKRQSRLTLRNDSRF